MSACSPIAHRMPGRSPPSTPPVRLTRSRTLRRTVEWGYHFPAGMHTSRRHCPPARSMTGCGLSPGDLLRASRSPAPSSVAGIAYAGISTYRGQASPIWRPHTLADLP